VAPKEKSSTSGATGIELREEGAMDLPEGPPRTASSPRMINSTVACISRNKPSHCLHIAGLEESPHVMEESAEMTQEKDALYMEMTPAAPALPYWSYEKS
jgi:hypothetical protein